MSFDTAGDPVKQTRESLYEAQLEREGLEYAGNFAATIRNAFFILSIVLFVISIVLWLSALRISVSSDVSFFWFIASIAFFGACVLSMGVSFFSHRKLVRFEKRQQAVCEEIVGLECELFLIDGATG